MLDHSDFTAFGRRFADSAARKFEMAQLISHALSDQSFSCRLASGSPDMNGIDFSVSANIVSLPD